MSLLVEREQLLRLSGCILAAFWLAAACSALVLWSNPLAPLLLVAGACGAAISLLLLQQPLAALYVMLFLRVLPSGFWPPALDDVNTVVVNSALALALGAFLLDVAAQRRPITWSPVCLLVALYIVFATVTLLWAPDFIEGKKKLVAYTSGLIVLFLMSNQVTSLSSVDGVMRVLRLIGWTTIIFGLYVALTDFHRGHRLKVLDINENELGVVLIVMVPGAIWPVFRSYGLVRALHLGLCIAFILCSIILIALSGSRGSTLSVAVMLVSLWFWRSVRPWALLMSVLVAGLVASSPALLDTLTNRLAQAQLEGGELGGRNVLWEASLLMLRDVPWSGAGIGNGPFALHKYIAMLTTHYNHMKNLASHNPLLEAGVDTGVAGMLVYASILACALWEFFSSWAHSPMRGRAQTAYFPLLFASTAGYLVSWIKAGGIETHSTFFLLLGLLLIPSCLSDAAGSSWHERPARELAPR
jgi:O-antigen ligase